MPPRLSGRAPAQCARSLQALELGASQRTLPVLLSRALSTSSQNLYAVVSPSAGGLRLPDDYIPPTQPPSARRPETRKTQFIRLYASLLRSTPLILFFQHNNLTAVEWAAVRRELKSALGSVPALSAPDSKPVDISSDIKLEVLRGRMFNVALKLTEFFDAEAAAKNAKPTTRGKGPYVHDLSHAAYESMKAFVPPEDSVYAQITPLVTGPVAGLIFPQVSAAHLAAALSVLAPSPQFPAPSKKKSPNFHDPACQSGLAKLLLVGGRIEGKVFDIEGVRWVGGIQGGLDGLRAQLVSVLQGAGLGITSTLESASRNLWLTLESRKSVLEEEQGEKREEKKE